MAEVKAIVEVEESELDGIKFHFGIKDEMFAKGVKFASLVAEGSNRTQAMMDSWDIDKASARSKAGEFFRRKWIQELIRYFKPDEETLYIGEIESIIKTGMEMIKDPRRDDRVKIEAMKALQPYIKVAVTKQESEITVKHEISAGDVKMTKMTDAIAQLTNSGKMIDETGSVIDVEFVQ